MHSYVQHQHGLRMARGHSLIETLEAVQKTWGSCAVDDHTWCGQYTNEGLFNKFTVGKFFSNLSELVAFENKGIKVVQLEELVHF